MVTLDEFLKIFHINNVIMSVKGKSKHENYISYFNPRKV